MSVLIETTIGDFVIDLFVKQRPRACLNFLKLCKMKYYNFNLFHYIEEGYIAQTGDPSGSGQGGASVFSLLEDQKVDCGVIEMEKLPKLTHSKTGSVSMVNDGNDCMGSQFVITLDDNVTSLDGKHCLFGQVTEGMETIEKLNGTLCNEDHQPYQDVRITHTVVLDDPFEDPDGFRPPRRSPSPTVDWLKSSALGVEELVNPDEGKSEDQIREDLEAKDARARAQILEMVGDLHYADERPPDNVLFVCKLNAVTTDEDLEIIFSRFGEIKCCEIIRDKKTGNSLQYAFIEFEKVDDCEAAYFKMDNVLIDDRRIHVDFSQSVAKNPKAAAGGGGGGGDWAQSYNKWRRDKQPAAAQSDKPRDHKPLPPRVDERSRRDEPDRHRRRDDNGHRDRSSRDDRSSDRHRRKERERHDDRHREKDVDRKRSRR